jgi:hypothetical protein
MKQFSLYDVLGVLAPGAVVVIGALALHPSLTGLLTDKGLSTGEFGLVVLLSYVVGNIVAGLANLLERPYLALKGGRHTKWAQKPSQNIITAEEFDRLESKLHKVGILKQNQTIESLSSDEWWGITREIHAFLDSRKLTNRIEIFNAQFGMNRGIATAFIVILAASLWHLGLHAWRYEILLAACAIISVYRMQKFSAYYAQTLFRTFLVAPNTPPKGTDESSD